MADNDDNDKREQQPHSSAAAIMQALTLDSDSDIGFGALNQQLHGQLFYTKKEYQAKNPNTPAVAWHSQSQRMARMARPEVVKAIYDADKLVGIPPEMHLKFIAGIENTRLDPSLGIERGGKGIGQVVDSTARGVVQDLAKTPEGQKIIAQADLTHYNTYNAYQNAVVSAAYIKDIMFKNKAKLDFTEGPNGIEFKSHEALMKASVETYVHYNVGPRDARTILNAYDNGNAGAPVSSLGLSPISITNNPSLYVGKNVGQAVQGIYNKLNINVDPLLTMVKDGPQPTAVAATGKAGYGQVADAVKNGNIVVPKKAHTLPYMKLKVETAQMDTGFGKTPKPGSDAIKDEQVASSGKPGSSVNLTNAYKNKGLSLMPGANGPTPPLGFGA